jgi:hypothetical protein
MISNDTPICDPQDDQFGVSPFAQAIARSIEKLTAPEGTVIALTGPWGSGKSSVVNLIRYHLKQAEEAESLKIIAFNPWWYPNEDAATRAFFQSLYVVLGKRLTERGRTIILSLGKKLLSSGNLISTAVNLFTFGFGGKIAETVSGAAAEMIKTDRTAEQDYHVLADELRKQTTRFLVIIDDIDRLAPDQALAIFRLVKSVGRLPNVIYLLAFDRTLAERTLEERYPADRHFLEKIVQAAFEVPLPDPTLLHEAILNAVLAFAQHPQDDEGVRFRNVLADVVNPLITLPRDLVRYMGSIAVSYAAIGEEVALADLLAIEALRLFRFPVYQAIQAHRAMLCGLGDNLRSGKETQAAYEGIFPAAAETDLEREQLRRALRRLFPRLDSIWGNMRYDTSSANAWRTERRICDPGCFSAYFRLVLGSDVLPRGLMNELIAKVDDRDFVQSFFRKRARATRRDGRSEVPLVMQELLGASDRISSEKVPVFIASMFAIMDDLDLERDEEHGLGSRSTNYQRMHWLLHVLVLERFDQQDRSYLLQTALQGASLGWTIDLTRRVHSEYQPRGHERPAPPTQRLVNAATSNALVAAALKRIREAAASGELLKKRHLLHDLFRWRDFAGGGDEVRTWSDAILGDDAFVLRMIDAVTSTSWVTSLGFDDMGDRVSQGVPHVQLDGLEAILDVHRFLRRVEEVESSLVGEREKHIVARFREGMRRGEEARARSRPAGPDADPMNGGERDEGPEILSEE